MRLRKKPSFRKVVKPWYDSDPFCIAISILMALVFFFSMLGVGVALKHAQYQRHWWLPLELGILSGILLATNLIRILTRVIKRHMEKEKM